MRISKELAKGSTGLLVLSVISRRDMYGYEITREIEQLSDDVFKLGEGTLYPILHALSGEGFLSDYWVEEEGTRRRKYYAITKQGRAELARRREEWEVYSGAVARVVGGVSIGLAGV